MKRKNILLINNSQVFMDITKRILERDGYTVKCAAGLAGARELLMDFSPDGIVLENDLPDVKGLDCCRELHQKTAAPIIFISNDKDDELPALQAGANDFLKKPFDYEIMKARLNLILNEKTSAAALSDDDKESGRETTRHMTIETEASDGALNKELVSGANRAYIAVFSAACIVLILMAYAFVNTFNGNPNFLIIPEKNVPLTELPFTKTDENAKSYAGDERCIIIPAVDGVTIPADARDVRMLLLNPEGNAYYLAFEIILADNEETLFSSGLLEPGMCLDEITISRGLSKGGFNAVIKIRAYNMDDFTIISVLKEDCLITVV